MFFKYSETVVYSIFTPPFFFTLRLLVLLHLDVFQYLATLIGYMFITLGSLCIKPCLISVNYSIFTSPFFTLRLLYLLHLDVFQIQCNGSLLLIYSTFTGSSTLIQYLPTLIGRQAGYLFITLHLFIVSLLYFTLRLLVSIPPLR